MEFDKMLPVNLVNPWPVTANKVLLEHSDRPLFTLVSGGVSSPGPA